MSANKMNAANTVAREKSLKVVISISEGKNLYDKYCGAGVLREVFYRNYDSIEHILTGYLDNATAGCIIRFNEYIRKFLILRYLLKLGMEGKSTGAIAG